MGSDSRLTTDKVQRFLTWACRQIEAEWLATVQLPPGSLVPLQDEITMASDLGLLTLGDDEAACVDAWPALTPFVRSYLDPPRTFPAPTRPHDPTDTLPDDTACDAATWEAKVDALLADVRAFHATLEEES